MGGGEVLILPHSRRRHILSCRGEPRHLTHCSRLSLAAGPGALLPQPGIIVCRAVGLHRRLTSRLGTEGSGARRRRNRQVGSGEFWPHGRVFYRLAGRRRGGFCHPAEACCLAIIWSSDEKRLRHAMDGVPQLMT